MRILLSTYKTIDYVLYSMINFYKYKIFTCSASKQYSNNNNDVSTEIQSSKIKIYESTQ